MRKDLKTGILVGAGLVTGALIIMSVWPGTSMESRLRQNMAVGGDEAALTGREQGEGLQVEGGPDEKNAEPVKEPDEAVAVAVEKKHEHQAQSAKVEEEQEDKQESHIHVVAGGETLSAISVMYYGSSGQWRRILDANPKAIADENRLVPGMRLVIPR
jgi:nucleoid-associated protein YgaU